MSEQAPRTVYNDDGMLQGWIHQILSCSVRGIIACVNVQPQKLLLMCCMVMARVISEMYVGDEMEVYRFRKACRDIFNETAKGMPVLPKPTFNDQTDTAAVG